MASMRTAYVQLSELMNTIESDMETLQVLWGRFMVASGEPECPVREHLKQGKVIRTALQKAVQILENWDRRTTPPASLERYGCADFQTPAQP